MLLHVKLPDLAQTAVARLQDVAIELETIQRINKGITMVLHGLSVRASDDESSSLEKQSERDFFAGIDDPVQEATLLSKDAFAGNTMNELPTRATIRSLKLTRYACGAWVHLPDVLHGYSHSTSSPHSSGCTIPQILDLPAYSIPVQPHQVCC